MVFDCGICVFHCNFIVNGVTCFLGSTEKHLQVHHVVDDDGELFGVTVSAPGTDTSNFGIVTGNEAFGTLQHYIFVRTFSSEFPSLTKTIVHHETEIVSTGIPFGIFYEPGETDGLLAPITIVGIVIYLPQ